MPAMAPLLSEDSARFAGLAAPPRARQLLAALQTLARQWLGPALTLTVVELERDLLRQAELARNGQMQAELVAHARQVHPFAEGFGERFLLQFADALAALLEADSPPVPAAQPPARPAVPTLTLVDDTDIDRNIVLAEIVRREMLRSANSLQLLGQRLAVVAACPALEAERVPFGPVVLCELVRRVGEQGGLELTAQLALFHSFERQVLDRLGEVIERANVLLAHEGILPGLVYTPYLARSASTRRIVTQPGRAPAGPRRPGATPLTAWNGGHAGSWSAMMHEALAPPAPAGTPAAATASADGPPPLPAAPLPLDLTAPAMSALHQLLAHARQAPAGTPGGIQDPAAAALPAQPPPLPATPPAAPVAPTGIAAPGAEPVPPGVPVPSAHVDAVLAQLQAAVAQGASPRSMGDLQTALLAQLRADHGEQAALTVKDTDTLDLLGLLFQQIQAQQRAPAPGHDLVGRLQVPLARAALADPGFFVRDEHPARELLNAIAEAGAHWLHDEDLDPQLVQKLGRTVDTVVDTFTDDPQVFADAHEEVQQHFRAAAHKAELAERRHVEAARGRERLEIARLQASEQIDLHCAQAQPPRFVQTLLRQAWADVLTLTQLRHGADSPQWHQRLQQTTQITAVTALPPGQGHAGDEALADEVDAALLQIGYHHDEARAIARRLSTPGGEDDSSSRTELSARLKARARLGEQNEAGDGRRSAPLARTTGEEDCYRQLRGLPFGTWFEFTTNQQGDVHRLRLSWYSLLTEHALFVNARGQKVAEHSLDSLARLMAQGQARVVTEDKGRLIDRAWQATLRTLRALAGDDHRTPAA